MNRQYHHWLIIGITTLCLFFCGPLRAQQGSSSLYEIDPSSFPTIRARLLALDANGQRLTGLLPDALTITENGEPRTVTALSCPPPQPLKYSSAVLSVDISESMYNWDPDLQLSKFGAELWVQSVALGKSECGITTFGDNSYINQDLTTNRAKLLDVIAGLKIAPGGTNFDEGFMGKPGGALSVVRNGRQRHVVLFITDGKAEGNESTILDAARKSNATIYAVVVGRSAPDILRSLAGATGGRCYDNITARERMREVITIILNDVQGGESCRIEWLSGSDCSVDRKVELTIRPDIRATAAYTAPRVTPAILQVDPVAIRFGRVPPGSIRDTIITLTALNRAITISGIAISNGVATIDSTGTPLPFTIQPGESRRVKLRFVPLDSASTFAQITFQSDACADPLAFATSGFPGVSPRTPELHVLYPNGGEHIAVGGDVDLWWGGILPGDPVSLEYSTDGGTTWIPIADRAGGFGHRWHVPNTPSDRCLLRATALPTDSMLLLNAHTFGFIGNGRLALWKEPKTIHLADPVTGTTIQTLDASDGHFRNFSSDGSRAAFETSNGVRIRDVGTGMIVENISVPEYSSIFGTDWDYYSIRKSKKLEIRKINGDTLLYAINAGEYRDFRFTNDFSHITTLDNEDPPHLIIQDTRPGGAIDTVTAPGNINGYLPYPDDKYVGVYFDSTYTDTYTHSVRMLGIWDIDAHSLVKWFPIDYAGHSVVGGSSNTAINQQQTLFASTIKTWERSSPSSGYDLLGYRVMVWDLNTGKLWKSYFSMTKFTLLSFSPDGKYLALGTEDTTTIVWDLYPTPVQSDLSDSLWAIEAPRFTTNAVDFGRVVVGTTKDSIITGIVHNTGTVPLHIDDVRIAGASQGEFPLRSAAGPYDIAPGAALTLEVEFAPSAAGLRSATADLITPNGTTSIPLHGEGVVPQLAITPARIDFGQVAIGESRDSIVDMMVRNMSSLPVTITDVAQQGPDLTQFSIMSGGGTFTLDPGEGRTLTLRFAPRFIGRTSGRIAFAYEGDGSPVASYLTGQGLGGIVSVASDSGAPGERIDLPLILSGPRRYIGETGMTAFEAELQFNAQLLLPTGEDHGIISDGKRTLTVHGSWDGRSDTLMRIPLIAGLGDTTATDVDITRFVWLDAGGKQSSADIETRDGTFNVIGLCIAGPRRLITSVGNAALKSSTPNPASSTVTIDYDLVEDGHTRLAIVDILGREVAILSDGESGAGHYSLTSTVTALPAGTYFYLLETPTRRITQRFEVIR